MLEMFFYEIEIIQDEMRESGERLLSPSLLLHHYLTSRLISSSHSVFKAIVFPTTYFNYAGNESSAEDW